MNPSHNPKLPKIPSNRESHQASRQESHRAAIRLEETGQVVVKAEVNKGNQDSQDNPDLHLTRKPMSDKQIDYDEHGLPILLAVRAPGQVAPQTTSGAVIQRGAASGNPNADPASGRFAGKASGRTATVQGNDVVIIQQTRSLPQGMTEELFEKRRDIVADAARELDDMDAGDAKEFLNGRVANLAQVNIDLFLRDVRAQRLDDLVDILDHQMRSRVAGMRRSRRFVRLQAPQGWTKRVFAGLDDNEVMKVVKRLEGRGWDPEDLSKNVIARVSDEGRRTQLEQLYGEQSKPKRRKRR